MRLSLISILIAALLLPALSSASPLTVTDGNTTISFEVHAPWNVLDGTTKGAEGAITILKPESSDRLRADVAVQDIRYKAGLSVAGRLIAGWLRLNPPTPAKFIIGKSTFDCPLKGALITKPCSGTVDGALTIWAKQYTIDVPVEVKPIKKGFLLTGAKRINWGEYGFGDPTSTIASLKPFIQLNFSIELDASQKSAA